MRIVASRYDIPTWRLAEASRYVIRMRPSLRTLGFRLAITLVIAVIVGGIGYPLLNMDREPAPPMPNAEAQRFEEMARDIERDAVEEGVLTQDQINEINARREQRAAQPQDPRAQVFAVGETIFWIVAAILGCFAILAPLSLLWQRVTIRRDAHNRIVVSKVGFFGVPSKATMDASSVNGISVWAQERMGWVQSAGRRSEGFFWHVALNGGQQISGIPLPSSGMEFVIHRQKDRPWPEAGFPAPVARFVAALEQLSGVKANREFEVYDARQHSGGFSTGRMITFGNPVTTKQTVYNSLNEMPPDIRAMAERMMEEARTGQPVHVQETMTSQTTRSFGGGRTQQTQSITYRDLGGQTHTYNSLDEMPPEIRAKYEAFLKRKS